MVSGSQLMLADGCRESCNRPNNPASANAPNPSPATRQVNRIGFHGFMLLSFVNTDILTPSATNIARISDKSNPEMSLPDRSAGSTDPSH
jgi:hypothetical protein